MTVAQTKAARRRIDEHYGKSPVQKRQARSVAQAMEVERKKAAKAASIKRK